MQYSSSLSVLASRAYPPGAQCALHTAELNFRQGLSLVLPGQALQRARQDPHPDHVLAGLGAYTQVDYRCFHTNG